jgi:hypothetical protein
MSYRLYIDTTVFGALFDDEDADRVTLTGTVLRRLRNAPFESFIGTPVLEEISIAPLRLRVALERHVKSLSPTLIEEGPTFAQASGCVHDGAACPDTEAK